MHSKTPISAALFIFSAISTAQINNLDTVAASRGAADQASFYKTLVTNAEFKTDIAAILSVAPPSAVAQVQNDPAGFANALNPASLAPAWAAAIPTPVLNSLDNLYANPDDAEYDVNVIATGPQASAVFANPAIPTTVRAAFTSDPVAFIEVLVTATTWPDWATSIPGALQTQVGQVINQQLSTFAADYEAIYSSFSTPPGSRLQTGASSSTPRTLSGTAASSGRPLYPTASGTGCPTCSSCSPVTVIVTVTSGSSSASTKPTVTPSPATTGTLSSRAGFPASSGASVGLPSKATGASGVASSSVLAFTGSKTGVVAFTGAAAPMKTAAMGAALLFAGAGALLNA